MFDLCYCFLQAGISENGQDRAKDLALHDLVRPDNGVENRWLEVAFSLIVTASHNYLVLIDELRQSSYFTWIDDSRIVRVLFWILTIEFNHGFAALRNKLICDLLVYISVSW